MGNVEKTPQRKGNMYLFFREKKGEEYVPSVVCVAYMVKEAHTLDITFRPKVSFTICLPLNFKTLPMLTLKVVSHIFTITKTARRHITQR